MQIAPIIFLIDIGSLGVPKKPKWLTIIAINIWPLIVKMKNLFIKFCYLIVTGILFSSCNNKPQVKIIEKPNILFIIADHQAYYGHSRPGDLALAVARMGIASSSDTPARG